MTDLLPFFTDGIVKDFILKNFVVTAYKSLCTNGLKLL